MRRSPDIANNDFAKNVVTVKGYDLGQHAKAEVTVALAALFGAPRPTVPRLGQSAFAAVVSNAYDKRCAITGNKVRPILQAAHIRPVAKDGQHRVDNGLLLRADVHIMFDRGYLGVHPDRRELMVSSQLRSEFGNGKEFDVLNGTVIARPEHEVDRPNRDFLQWHADTIYRR